MESLPPARRCAKCWVCNISSDITQRCMCTSDKSESKQNSKSFPPLHPKPCFCYYLEPYSDTPTFRAFVQTREDSTPWELGGWITVSFMTCVPKKECQTDSFCGILVSLSLILGLVEKNKTKQKPLMCILIPLRPGKVRCASINTRMCGP